MCLICGRDNAFGLHARYYELAPDEAAAAGAARGSASCLTPRHLHAARRAPELPWPAPRRCELGHPRRDHRPRHPAAPAGHLGRHRRVQRALPAAAASGRGRPLCRAHHARHEPPVRGQRRDPAARRRGRRRKPPASTSSSRSATSPTTDFAEREWFADPRDLPEDVELSPARPAPSARRPTAVILPCRPRLPPVASRRVRTTGDAAPERPRAGGPSRTARPRRLHRPAVAAGSGFTSP